MAKMLLKLIFVSFVLPQCAFALKCVTGLTESPPTDTDDKLVSVECPLSFAFCERKNWISDAGKNIRKVSTNQINYCINHFVAKIGLPYMCHCIVCARKVTS